MPEAKSMAINILLLGLCFDKFLNRCSSSYVFFNRMARLDQLRESIRESPQVEWRIANGGHHGLATFQSDRTIEIIKKGLLKLCEEHKKEWEESLVSRAA